MMDLKTIGTVLVLTIPFFFLTVWAIVDCLHKDFGTVGKKALWGLIAAIPFIGGIIYFIFAYRKGKKADLDKLF